MNSAKLNGEKLVEYGDKLITINNIIVPCSLFIAI